MLKEAILDYMGWIKSVEDHRGSHSSLRYTQILTDFLIYVIHKGMAWEEMFTPDTLMLFEPIVATWEPPGPSGHYRIIFLLRAKSVSPFRSQSLIALYRTSTNSTSSISHKAGSLPIDTSGRSEGCWAYCMSIFTGTTSSCRV